MSVEILAKAMKKQFIEKKPLKANKHTKQMFKQLILREIQLK